MLDYKFNSILGRHEKVDFLSLVNEKNKDLASKEALDLL
jgi:hypothetical protein